jgi:probable rRNA maturation factor
MPTIVIQRPYRKGFLPASKELRQFATNVLATYQPDTEVTIRIVSSEEITELNSVYRHKDKSTNVLSFKIDIPDGMHLSPLPLGDIVICADVVNEEAAAQNKAPIAHWAHMVVHGALHLLGYDHETDSDNKKMQAIEIDMMQALGFPNPYKIEDE